MPPPLRRPGRVGLGMLFAAALACGDANPPAARSADSADSGDVLYHHADRRYEVEALAVAAAMRVEIKPRAPWKVSDAYPASLSWAHGSERGGDAAAAADSTPEAVAFELPRPAQAGDDPVRATLRFAMCLEDICEPLVHVLELATRAGR